MLSELHVGKVYFLSTLNMFKKNKRGHLEAFLALGRLKEACALEVDSPGRTCLQKTSC